METTIKLKSSFIKSATYHKDKKRLDIQIGEMIYCYYGVTSQKVAMFKRSISKGSYYATKIKGHYKVIRRKLK